MISLLSVNTHIVLSVYYFRARRCRLEDYKKDQEGDENYFHTINVLESITYWVYCFIICVSTPASEKVLTTFRLFAPDKQPWTGEGFVTCINITCTLNFCHFRLWSLAVELAVCWKKKALTGILLHITPCPTRCRWSNSTALCFYCHRLSLIPSIYKRVFISSSVCSRYWADKRPLTFCSRTKKLDESSEGHFRAQGLITSPSAAALRALRGGRAVVSVLWEINTSQLLLWN